MSGPASSRSSTIATACGLPRSTWTAGPGAVSDADLGLLQHLRGAHVDADPLGAEGQRLDPVTGRDRQRVARVDVGVGGEVEPQHPDAVAAHLAQRPVGVAVVHEPDRVAAGGHRRRVVRRVGAHHPDHAVAADPGAPVAQRRHLLGGQLEPAVGVGHQHEVVLGAVTLDEGDLHGPIVGTARSESTPGSASQSRKYSPKRPCRHGPTCGRFSARSILPWRGAGRRCHGSGDPGGSETRDTAYRIGVPQAATASVPVGTQRTRGSLRNHASCRRANRRVPTTVRRRDSSSSISPARNASTCW